MTKRRKTIKHSLMGPPSVCATKRKFATEEAALEGAELRMLDNMTLDITIYRCDECRQWHLKRRTPAERIE